MKSLRHRLAHLFGWYGGHPVHFTFDVCPGVERQWFKGFRCAKCGTISMVEPKTVAPEFEAAVTRLMRLDMQ